MKELILKGGAIYPITQQTLKKGVLYIKDGKIIGIYRQESLQPENRQARVMDLSGKHILPGLIDAHTHLGIFEERIGKVGQDNNETSEPVTPHLRAIDGINPNDIGFQDAFRAGVTTVMTGPGSNNAVGGLNMAVRTYGTIIDQMVVKNPTGLKIALGENPMTTYGAKGASPVTRMGNAALVRSMFIRAQDYQLQREKGNINYREPAMEAALLALNREIPVRIHAHRADDMVTAIRLAEEFGLRLIIEHGTEGYLITDYLVEKQVPVTVGPVLTPRDKMELNKRSYDTAARLTEAGIPIAIITDHPYNSIEHLRLSAILAHQEGLREDIALQAITINPAIILNIEDRVGSLEPGKDADIVVLNGHPLDADSKVEQVYIKGELIYDARQQADHCRN